MKKPGKKPGFFVLRQWQVILVRELSITFPFTEVIMLYLLCLLGKARSQCGSGPHFPTRSRHTQ